MFDSKQALKILEAKADSMRNKPWLPPDLIDIVTGAARMQIEELERIAQSAPPLPETLIADADQHAQGKPLLSAENFPYDPAQALDLWNRLGGLLRGKGGHLAEAVDFISIEADNGRLDRSAALKALLHDDGEFFAHWAGMMPDAPGLLRFLAKSSLAPAIMSQEEHLAAYHDASSIWSYGYCPHCGGLPLIGRLKNKEGARWHTCSFCRLEFRAKRLQCPFCLEENQENILVISSQDEPGYEINACNSCKNYIKIIDFREFAGRPSIPAIDDLESLTLDIVAKNKGFSRTTTSEWGF